jgi:putative phosphoesterase
MSDSHGNKDAMLKAIALELPELILHLGDHDKDCVSIGWEYPEIPIHSVRGNCDRLSDNIDIDEFTLGGKRFLITHGHLYNVKTGYSYIISFAASRGADILLFGHTHIPYYAEVENVTVINPGSIGTIGKTYAILELKNGDVTCMIKKVRKFF